ETNRLQRLLRLHTRPVRAEEHEGSLELYCISADLDSAFVGQVQCSVSLELPVAESVIAPGSRGGMSGITTRSTRDDSDHTRCLRRNGRARRLRHLAPLLSEKHRTQLMMIVLVRPELCSRRSGTATPTVAYSLPGRSTRTRSDLFDASSLRTSV